MPRCYLLQQEEQLIFSQPPPGASQHGSERRPQPCSDWREYCYSSSSDWSAASPSFWGAPSNHSIQKLCCGRRMRRRWLNLDSSVFGKSLHHGPSPEERGVRRTAARPRSGVRVVFGWCELLRAEPRQRVHVPAASRKIRVFLSNGVKEWYDGGRISGNCVCVCPRVRASCYRRARARARSPMLMASRRCALT